MAGSGRCGWRFDSWRGWNEMKVEDVLGGKFYVKIQPGTNADRRNSDSSDQPQDLTDQTTALESLRIKEHGKRPSEVN